MKSVTRLAPVVLLVAGLCLQGEASSWAQGNSGEVISAVARNYDRATRTGGSLEGIEVQIDHKGIVAGYEAKSGWINMSTTAYYIRGAAEEERKIDLVLDGVSFWLNRGGRTWSDFEIKQARFEGIGEPTRTQTSITEILPGFNRPVILVDQTHRLMPSLRSLGEITFVPEEPPLHYAIDNGFEDIVQLLARDSTAINSRSPRIGRTPLHHAAVSNNARLVDLLISRGAEIDAKDYEYEATPLMMASRQGRPAIVEALISAGADVRTRDKEGKTPLEGAREAYESYLRLVELKLVRFSAEVESRHDEVIRLLSAAASQGKP